MDVNGFYDSIDGEKIGVISVAVLVGAYHQMKKYGIIDHLKNYDITWDKIVTKAKMRYDVAKAIEPLDDDAVLQFLQILAPGPDGTIDEQEAERVICDFVKYYNRKSKMLPMYKKKQL